MNKGGGQIYSCNLIKIILSYIQEQVESVLSKKICNLLFLLLIVRKTVLFA